MNDRSSVRKSRNDNEVSTYLSETNLLAFENLLQLWREFVTVYSTMTQMIKNVFSISMTDVDVKRLFFMTRDVITYRRNRFRRRIIERIMIIKRTKWFSKNSTFEMLSVFVNIINQIMMKDELIENESSLIIEWINDDHEFDVNSNASSQESIYSSKSNFESDDALYIVTTQNRTLSSLQVVISSFRNQLSVDSSTFDFVSSRQQLFTRSTSFSFVNTRNVQITYITRRQI